MLSSGIDRKRLAPTAATLLSIVGVSLAQAVALQTASARARAPAPASASAYSVRRVCPPAAPGHARCMALELVPRSTPATTATTAAAATPSHKGHGARAAASCDPPLATEGCDGLRPQDLHAAYDLPTTAPVPQTIAIVAAGDDPTAAGDLAVYDSVFGLPPCTHKNGCFTKLNGEGKRSPLPPPSVEAAKESSLDVQIAHAVCQNCRILLVEASSSALGALEEAEDAAAAAGATEISNSWGEAEPPEPPDEGAAFDHPGIVITVAAGDTGYLNWGSGAEGGHAEYPAASPDVIAVGGTRLELGPASEWLGETVWEDEAGSGGSACSERFAAPPWQTALANWSAVGCGSHRAVADVAADGDPLTGAATWDSLKGPEGFPAQWRRLGGTSLGAPLIAAAFALAGGADGVAYPAQTLYEDAQREPQALHDITAGTNGACGKLEGCTTAEEQASCDDAAICVAGSGYDGPTGVGSLDGIAALAPLPPRKAQQIAFGSTPPASATAGGASYMVTAEASSGLPVTLRSATPAVCALAGDTASFLAAGTCEIVAAQPGNGEWAAAPEVEQSFSVAPTPAEPAPPAGETLSFTSSYEPPVAADSRFSLGRSPSIDRGDGAIAFQASVANAGSFRWLLTFANGSFGVIEGGSSSCAPGWIRLRGRCRPAELLFGQGTANIAALESVRFTVHPSPAAMLALRRALRRHGALRVTALLRFQSVLGGTPVTSTLALSVRPDAP